MLAGAVPTRGSCQGLLTAEARGELGLALKWESEFLFLELKNGIHKRTNTHSSKRIGFIREEESTKLLAKTLRGGKEPSRRQGLWWFYIFSSINLYIFGWLLFLNHIISNQSFLWLLLILRLCCPFFMIPTMDQMYGLMITIVFLLGVWDRS